MTMHRTPSLCWWWCKVFNLRAFRGVCRSLRSVQLTASVVALSACGGQADRPRHQSVNNIMFARRISETHAWCCARIEQRRQVVREDGRNSRRVGSARGEAASDRLSQRCAAFQGRANEPAHRRRCPRLARKLDLHASRVSFLLTSRLKLLPLKLQRRRRDVNKHT